MPQSSEVLKLKYLGYGSVGYDNPNVQPPLKFHLGLCYRYILIAGVSIVIITLSVLGGRAYIQSLKSSSDKLYSIYIIRRAEASDDPLHACNPPINPMQFFSDKVLGEKCFVKNLCGGAFLTERGQERAHCISKKLRLKGLTQIFAQNPGRCDDKNVQKRGYQTVLPLAIAMNMTIDTTFYRGNEMQMARYITNSEGRNNVCLNVNLQGSYLISWNHESLGLLMKELGCTGYRCRLSSDLANDDYDKVYRLDLSCVSGKFITSYTMAEKCNL